MKKKEVSSHKTLICLIMSGLTPLVIIGIAYALKGIYVGGKNTILIMDMQAQYMPFYAMLRNMKSTDNSLFFSMTGALGVNFWGNFAYYLTSPFAWLSAFVPVQYLPDYIYIITIVKLGLCGLSFGCFLIYIKNNRQLFFIYLLSCSYALMSFNVAYAMNIMWIDGIILLPLILVGIEKMLKGEKTIVFISSVAASLMLNYYISFMSAVFAVIYLIIRLFETKKWEIQLLKRFVISALLGIGISCPIVLPGVLAMSQGKMVEEQYIPETWRYSIGGLAGQFMSGSYDTVYYGGLPFLFCGTGTLLLVLLFFALGKEKRLIKLAYGFVILFYLFSMCFTPFDRALHGFHDTACFEVRYAFVFCCLLLIIAQKGVDALLLHIKGNDISILMKCLIGGFVMIELFFNSSIVTARLMEEIHYRPRSEYDRILESKSRLLSLIDDEGVFRVSDNASYTHDEGAWLGYNGFGYFSSNYDMKTMNFLGALGEDQADHNLTDRNRTLLEESLFGAKYRLNYARGINGNDILARDGLYTLAENEDALSIGYMVDYTSDDGDSELSNNAFANQNTIARELSGIEEDVFEELEITHEEELSDPNYAKWIHIETEAKDTGSLWLYMEWADSQDRKKYNVAIEETDNPYNQRTGEIMSELFVNGNDYGDFLSINNSFIVYLGEHKKDEKISIDARSNIYFGEAHLGYMNQEVYQKVIDHLNKGQWDITSHGKGKFEGTIDAGKGGNMLITIPKMKGWHIEVDGEKCEIGDYRNTLICINLAPGNHLITMKYRSPGVIIGFVLGSILLILTLVLEFCKRSLKLTD